jgi:hypothetical protein
VNARAAKATAKRNGNLFIELRFTGFLIVFAAAKVFIPFDYARIRLEKINISQ